MIQLGRVGLGTASLSGLYAAVHGDTAERVVDRAWELGIRTFDTAPSYGSGWAERRLGRALARRRRDEYVVSTKIGRRFRRGLPGEWHGAPQITPHFDFSYDAALRSLEESLDRLGLDRVDIALVQNPDKHYKEALSGAFRALARVRDEGVVRAIGVDMNQTELLVRFAREADLDCILVAGRYTLLDRSAAPELLPLCDERSIAVIAGGVFNSGVLAGGDTFDYAKAPDRVVTRVAELKAICGWHHVPLPAAALQFPLLHDAVHCVLVGCRTLAEVEEDVRLFELDLPGGLWLDVADR